MKVGILIFQNVEELDFVGPWEILGMWAKHAGGPEQRYIIGQSCMPVACAKGLTWGVKFDGLNVLFFHCFCSIKLVFSLFLCIFR